MNKTTVRCGMVNMEAKSKWQCPKCGVGLPYNPTYRIGTYKKDVISEVMLPSIIIASKWLLSA
jgi:hypothetical protein